MITKLLPASNDVIQELWRVGLTLVPRTLAQDLLKMPAGTAYQWNPLADRAEWESRGWQAVPCERHPGLFAPYGQGGEIITMGTLLLMEKDAALVAAEKAKCVDQAHQNVVDWGTRAGANGLSGAATVDKATLVVGDGGSEPDVARQTRIPGDMIPHYAAIMRERDRLRDQWYRDHPERNITPEISGDLMRQAIRVVRDRLHNPSQQENDNGTSPSLGTESSGKPAEHGD